MKTSRTDIEINKKQCYCPNSSWEGFSTSKLKYGNFFIYKEFYTDGSFSRRLAKCLGQVRPREGGNWRILTQAASTCMRYTMERWIEFTEVVEVIPADRMKPQIKSFFEEAENEQ